jgi:hypothetical protein
MVALDHDIREDDVQPVVDAIRMVKHVAHVTTQEVESSDYAARSSVLHNTRMKLYEAIREVFDDLKLD